MEFNINSPKYGIKQILIDDEDWDRIKKHKWCIIKTQNNFYVVTNIIENKCKRSLRLHRLIMKIKNSKILVDHKNLDTLDNRKQNLRICTQAQNMMNRGKTIINNNGYKGVDWLIKNKRWRARIKLNYKQINLGHFKNKKDAAIAYNNAASKYHGEFARLNKI